MRFPSPAPPWAGSKVVQSMTCVGWWNHSQDTLLGPYHKRPKVHTGHARRISETGILARCWCDVGFRATQQSVGVWDKELDHARNLSSNSHFSRKRIYVPEYQAGQRNWRPADGGAGRAPPPQAAVSGSVRGTITMEGALHAVFGCSGGWRDAWWPSEFGTLASSQEELEFLNLEDTVAPSSLSQMPRGKRHSRDSWLLQNHLEGSLKHRLLGPIHQGSHLVGLG